MSKYEKQPTIVTNIGGRQWQNPMNCIITLLVSNPNVVATFLVAKYASFLQPLNHLEILLLCSLVSLTLI
jgi:hypothetical protein